MRNYTYLGGARFTVNNLFRSLRFDIDRLDMSWVDGEKPEFSRGLRVVDNDEVNTVTVDGEDGDNLIYSLTYIFSKEDGADNFRAATDEYLKVALETKEFLVTNQKKDPQGKPEVAESVLVKQDSHPESSRQIHSSQLFARLAECRRGMAYS
ncbi:MAG: hypothetical protein B7Y05_04055 [Polynucleobacter sp. 24-46-87]|jgi:hypothetical protein|uniref:hypothetical protein n=1 Tax=unclassified Polynucleobacter TaxID=2640945 RepID=UPI000BD31DA7|nr:MULTISPECIES: hypothetical protein [unclassified Polynucleobacter]OYY20621.1 MAG: hypothetical protein B7Y67_05010 [Polynucleobacter sp. 35-46-11]OZA15409.1 MAG: hypothetical protein B7Y05_04055 [Polynucleobacter sp. 24-46-87]OZA77146.1 MAG: hypothetical protein B7X71_05905 [Polynucleobacter sp. 39-46-10]